MAEFIHADKPQESIFDVDAERLARVYAEAGLNAAGDVAVQETVVLELEAVVRDVLSVDRRIEEVFGSELIAADEKVAMLDRILGNQASATTLNLLKVLARHKRLGLIRDVARAARKMWQTRSGQLPVELETANPLEPALEQEILAAFGAALGLNPIVTQRVNPDLIAGFVIRVGDRVYDGSVRTRLEKVRVQMIDRAIDAIQRGPQRFIDTTKA
jgi:F-type H+-transporting ATPase subunit delta